MKSVAANRHSLRGYLKFRGLTLCSQRVRQDGFTSRRARDPSRVAWRLTVTGEVQHLTPDDGDLIVGVTEGITQRDIW